MDNSPPRPSAAESIELRRRQRGKNIALVIVLVVMVALFYGITLARFKVS